MKNLIYPVILAGGSGTRLWPRSRERSPKQFIPLIDGKSLFQETCLRFSDDTMFGHITVITHEEHRFLVRDQLKELMIDDAIIITEPMAKNTTAACLSGAHFLLNTVGDVPILFTPADHIIKDEQHLFTALEHALPFVRNGSVCIFGITPSSPHTGYGYIIGKETLAEGILGSITFIEKPSKEKAEELLAEGALWNSGLYFCAASTLAAEASLYTGITNSVVRTFFSKNTRVSNGFLMIDKDTYQELDPISIDKGITELSKNLILAPTTIQWSDLGSWSSLYEHFEKNEHGNVVRGDTVVIDTKNSYIESDKRLVTVLGLENVGVVETDDAVLVFSLPHSEHIKKIVTSLVNNKRQETIVHTTVHRPWGQYTILGDDTHFKSKKIIVMPGAELSLQRHKRRAEHWIVVKGIATVTRDTEVFELKENESTFLPMGSMHRLQNKHDEILSLIEVQTGDYFGEDDIERFEDTYGRV